MRYVDMVSAAGSDRHRTALISGEEHLTFADLDERVGRLGAAFRAQGLSAGDRVALLTLNELEVTEIQAACMRSGFAAVPINFRLSPAEIAYILDDVTPSLLVVGRGLEDLARESASLTGIGLELVSLSNDGRQIPYREFLAAGDADPEADPTEPTLPAVVMYTSGTTGRPKGAVIDRAALTSRISQAAVELRAVKDDVWLQSLPMFHISSICTYGILSRGGTAVQMTAFTPDRFLRLVTEHRCTKSGLVPTVIDMLLEHPDLTVADLTSLQMVVYGGSAMSPTLLDRARPAFGCGFQQWYGQTEAGAVTVLQPEDHRTDETCAGSAGTSAFGWEVRVVDEQGSSRPDGEVGELVGRSTTVMTEYWKRPNATRETLRDGWLHTGDMAYCQNGHFFLVDRKNDMIITGGENVYPREVESLLCDHPRVADAAVVGIPDDRWGETVVAFVVGTGTAEDLSAWTAERLAKYKVPRGWQSIDVIPRNAMGKIDRRALRSEWTNSRI
jgi:acyl-CoA synthetase (AMP-forming)/AMP-acid ligase II